MPCSHNAGLIDLLAEVHQHEKDRSILLGLASHRSRRTLDRVADQRHWLSIKRLLGYAPDLNPNEQVGGRTCLTTGWLDGWMDS